MMAPLLGETDLRQWNEKIGNSTYKRALKPLLISNMDLHLGKNQTRWKER